MGEKSFTPTRGRERVLPKKTKQEILIKNKSGIRNAWEIMLLVEKLTNVPENLIPLISGLSNDNPAALLVTPQNTQPPILKMDCVMKIDL